MKRSFGFTGSRYGISKSQSAVIEGFMLEATHLHHGDCVGADKEVADFAERFGVPTTIHPPLKNKLRAFHNWGRILKALPYLERNRSIVDDCDVLLACTRSDEIQRSGTWATIRYARKIGKPIILVQTDGKIVMEFNDGR